MLDFGHLCTLNLLMMYKYGFAAIAELLDNAVDEVNMFWPCMY